MNRNIIKTLSLFVVVFFSVFFINFDDVRAEDACDGTNPNDVCDGDGKGYAKCYYTWDDGAADNGGEMIYYEGNTVLLGEFYRPYKLGIAAYKGSDGHFYAWADVGCGEGGGQSYSKTTTGHCNIDNYDTRFNKFYDNSVCYFLSYGGKFKDKSTGSLNLGACRRARTSSNITWTCPSQIYINKLGMNNNMSVFFSESACNQSATPTKCTIAVSLSSKQVSQIGQPGQLTVNNYTTKAKDVATKSVTDAAQEENNQYLEWIKNWGRTDSSDVKAGATGDCDIIPRSIIKFLNYLFLIIQIIGILLVVVMSAIEFIKALTGSDEDGFKGAIKNTFRRIIAIVILLMLPGIITWALNVVNDNRYQKGEDGEYVIGTDGNPLCSDEQDKQNEQDEQDE